MGGEEGRNDLPHWALTPVMHKLQRPRKPRYMISLSLSLSYRAVRCDAVPATAAMPQRALRMISIILSYCRTVVRLAVIQPTACRLRSYCHPVILSSCHPVILSSCHPVVLSSCRPVILSSCRPVVLSSCHPVILSSCRPVVLS